MNWSVEYFIDERDCIACEYRDRPMHEDPCYKCDKTKSHDAFKPDSIDNITDRISEA